MRFTLKDDGYPFKKIMQGKKWIGRVYKDANDMYVGMIGKTEHRDVSFLTAFEGVVAKHCGHEDIVAMKMHNAKVRRVNSHNRAIAQHAADELLRGNFEPFEKLFLREGK